MFSHVCGTPRGAYFVSDAATTLLSLLSLLPGVIGAPLKASRLRHQQWVGPIAGLVVAHQLQHYVYISCWRKGPQTYVQYT